MLKRKENICILIDDSSRNYFHLASKQKG